MKLFMLNATTACALLAAQCPMAEAQGPIGYQSGPTTQYMDGPVQPSSGRSNPALSYFGGQSAVRLASRPTRPTALPQAPPRQAGPAVKPFSDVRSGPAISPYLLLDNRESATGVPLYYSLVKPQLDQMRYNQQMQAEYGRMQQQLQTAAPGAARGVPTTGHVAQFMNLGGYYSQPQR